LGFILLFFFIFAHVRSCPKNPTCLAQAHLSYAQAQYLSAVHSNTLSSAIESTYSCLPNSSSEFPAHLHYYLRAICEVLFCAFFFSSFMLGCHSLSLPLISCNLDVERNLRQLRSERNSNLLREPPIKTMVEGHPVALRDYYLPTMHMHFSLIAPAARCYGSSL
jgi:hypothetical protein